MSWCAPARPLLALGEAPCGQQAHPRRVTAALVSAAAGVKACRNSFCRCGGPYRGAANASNSLAIVITARVALGITAERCDQLRRLQLDSAGLLPTHLVKVTGNSRPDYLWTPVGRSCGGRSCGVRARRDRD